MLTLCLACSVSTRSTPRERSKRKGGNRPSEREAREKEKNDRQTILARLDNREDVAIRYYSGPRG